jgi:hypothetical protein
MAKPPCDLCNGTGEASLRDKRGDTHYLECPECDGTGVDFDAEDEDEDEDEDDEKKDEEGEEMEYPPSTAASITTPEQLKAAVERWNAGPPKPPPLPPKPNLWSRFKSWVGDIHDRR